MGAWTIPRKQEIRISGTVIETWADTDMLRGPFLTPTSRGGLWLSHPRPTFPALPSLVTIAEDVVVGKKKADAR